MKKELLEKIIEFLDYVSKQKPECPDYWSICGQCGRNIEDADELLDEIKAELK